MLAPEWKRFGTLVKQSQKLKNVSYHKLYDILKQHQHEVNEIQAEKIARVANPLALVAQQQPIYHPQTHPTHYNQNNSTRSQQAATRNIGKAIVNSPQPIYDQEPSMVDDDDETSKDKEIDKLMALISLSFKKSTNLPTTTFELHRTPVVQIRIILYGFTEMLGMDIKEFGHVARECQKPKRAKDAAYHREKMLLCKQEEAKIQLNAEQADWKDDTDDESDDQELEAHYMYMAKLQQVSPDAVDFRPIFDTELEQKVKNDDHYDVFAIECQHPEQSESVHKTYLIEQDAHNVEHINQNDDDVDLAKERELLASLIEKFKCEIDETKNRNTLLETSNKVLVEKLKSEIEDFKNKNKSLTEANNKLSKENELLYADFKKSKAELKRRDSIEYASEMELACAKVRGDFLSYKMESQKSCNKYTQSINDLNQMISEMKNKLSAHQDTISILKQQKDAQIKLYKSREDKEIEKVIDLENKVKVLDKVLDNIVYKTVQTVQTMNMLNNKCRTSFVKPEYLKKAKQANPRLYDIGCYNDNLALMLSPESDEVIRLEKESRSKLSDLIRPFDYAKLNSLYDLFVPQREKSSEQRYFLERSRIRHINVQNEKKKESFQKQTTFLEKRMDESISVNKNCKSSLEIVNIQMNINTIITGVELCKQKIANRTYFGHIDPFIQNTIEQNFCPVISKINVGLHLFLKRLNEEMVVDLRYINSLELEVDSLTSQLET
nr:hypothetical protein [Tanacetum cinerariifolium]